MVKECCGKEMVWVQFAWDISREGYYVSFGYWCCKKCEKTIGSHNDFLTRKFTLPGYSKEKLKAVCL